MNDLHARASRLSTQAHALADADDNDGAAMLAAEALALLAADGSVQTPLAVHLNTLSAMLAHRRGDAAMSARHATAAMGTAEALGDAALQAKSNLAMARAYLTAGDNEQMLAVLEAAWPASRDGADLHQRLWCQTLFAIAHKDIGDCHAALGWFQQAQATAQTLGSERMLALCAANLTGPWLDIADAAAAHGDAAAAQVAWQAAVVAADLALPMITAVGVMRWRKVAVINRSAALVGLARDAEAEDGLTLARQLAEQSGNPTDCVLVALYAARMLRRQGDLAGAEAEVSRGIAEGEAGGARIALIDLYEFGSLLAESRGDLGLALSRARRLHALHLAVAADKAAMRSKLLAIRLETERAQTDALVAREHAAKLEQANHALEQQAETLGLQALQDPLTGVANRRQLDAMLFRAHADARASGAALCVVMLDVDHFKAINDRHSHAVGDTVLKQLGAMLRGACRSTDLAARYGGEEFVLVLPDTTPRDALTIADRLRMTVEAFGWSAIAPGLQVTVSGGVTDIADAADCVQGLSLADTLLYQAKAGGRNRVAHGSAARAVSVQQAQITTARH